MHSAGVQALLDIAIRFLLNKGVDGFRIDTVSHIREDVAFLATGQGLKEILEEYRDRVAKTQIGVKKIEDVKIRVT